VPTRYKGAEQAQQQYRQRHEVVETGDLVHAGLLGPGAQQRDALAMGGEGLPCGFELQLPYLFDGLVEGVAGKDEGSDLLACA
jgi:hypothetical protein